ncbi:DNA polymerase III subunit beta [Mycoplasmopsis felifaucium]|uniref:DNA polymerase III subunit beta n=1 Tax=Mycoplasmopsis felifaucium TaxID=35768 RepID=UPI000484B8A6|nr:DNA polymerase III subunit beta [Mycoplasmopsis felifaucium]
MKIRINKNVLDNVIEIVSRFTDPTSSFFSMRCILISASEEKIIFKACNEVTSIIKYIDVDDNDVFVEQTGEILVQCNLLKNIVKKLSGFIELKTDLNNNLEILQEDSRYNLNTSDINSFIKIDENLNIKKFEIDTNEFRKAVKDVAFAASTEANLIYKCINFKSSGSRLNLAATDVYRLAYYSINTGKQLDEFNFNVNAKDVKELIPTDAPETITLFYNSVKFGVEYKNTITTARITDLPFHDIEQLFNQVLSETKYKLTINKKEINGLLNKIWLNTSEKQNRIEIKINKNELSIYSRLDEIGDSFVKTSQFNIEGGSMIFDINYNFLKDALNILDDEIIFLFDDKIQKILVLSKSNPNSKQIVTPMRR